jgi:Zn-dependent protease with chaperone function
MRRTLRSLTLRLIGYAAALDGALVAGLVIAFLSPVVPAWFPIVCGLLYAAATLIYTEILVSTSRPLDESEPADRVILEAAERTAARLGLPTPRILQTPAVGGILNAFATDLVVGPPAIILTDRTALLARRGAISPASLAGVISHELAHLSAGDSIPRGLLSVQAVAVRIAAGLGIIALIFPGPRELLLADPTRLALALTAPLLFSLLAGAFERAGERRADEVARSLKGLADFGGFLRAAREERDEIAVLRRTPATPLEAMERIVEGHRALEARIARMNEIAVAAYHPIGAPPEPAQPIAPDLDPTARRLALAARLRALTEEVDYRIAGRVNRELLRTLDTTRRTIALLGYEAEATSLIDPSMIRGAHRPDPTRRAVEHLLSDLEAESYRVSVLARALRHYERANGAERMSLSSRVQRTALRFGLRLVRLWLGRLSVNRKIGRAQSELQSQR